MMRAASSMGVDGAVVSGARLMISDTGRAISSPVGCSENGFASGGLASDTSRAVTIPLPLGLLGDGVAGRGAPQGHFGSRDYSHQLRAARVGLGHQETPEAVCEH